MRLLNTATHRLETFVSTQVPLYAIISHRWAAHGVGFQELERDGEERWQTDAYILEIGHDSPGVGCVGCVGWRFALVLCRKRRADGGSKGLHCGGGGCGAER